MTNRTFLECLFEELQGFVEVRSIYKIQDQAQVKAYFYSSINDLLNDCEVIDTLAEKADIYFGVCPRKVQRGDKGAVQKVNALWADVDFKDFKGGVEEALSKINSFPFQPSIVVETGNGFHLYWLLRESEEINNLTNVNHIEQYLKGLAVALNGDLAAAELARILRLPGTINHKDPAEDKYVRVLRDNSEKRYNLSDFDSILPTLSFDKGINYQGWISEALVGLKVGNRNGNFAKLTGKLHHGNWNPKDIYTLLEPHAAKADFSLDELQKEVDGICKRYPKGGSFPNLTYIGAETETEAKSYKTITLKKLLLNKDIAIDWIVEGILPKEGAGILGGAPGLGKTWLILDLAIECSRGGKWLDNFKTTQAKVLYIDEESSEALLTRRLNKLLKEKGILLEDSLGIQFLIGQGIFLNDSVAVDKLKDVIRDVKPGLIIIDSLIRVHSLDENSSKDMSKIFAVIKCIIREFKCAVLFTDHQRKPGQFTNGGDVSLRGSTEKVAFVDTLLSFKRKDDLLIVEHSKSRFAEALPAFLVEIKDLSEQTTKVSYMGDAEARIQAERMRTSGDIIKLFLGDGLWKSRKEVLEKGKGYGSKTVDATLKYFVDSEVVELQKRGKEHFYRLRENCSKDNMTLLNANNSGDYE